MVDILSACACACVLYIHMYIAGLHFFAFTSPPPHMTVEQTLLPCQFCGQAFAKSALQQHQVSGETILRGGEGVGLFEDE